MYSRFHKQSDSTLLNAWRSVNLVQEEEYREVEVVEDDLPSLVTRQVIVQMPPSLVPQNQNGEDSTTETASTSSNSQSDTDNDEAEQIVLPVPAVQNPHPMTTRARADIIKPNPRYAMVIIKTDCHEPKSVKAALKDPRWNGAMQEETNNMEETETYELVPPEEDQHPVGCGWVYKIKLNADGTVLKPRARLVARGNEQEEGVDFLETFSPVVRTATIRTVLHVVVTKKWKIKQLDVQDAFLHGDLK